MNVTVYTDASADAARGRSAYGLWIRSDGLRVLRSGVCKGDITDANDAELYAIYAGVCTVLRLGEKFRIRFSRVLVVTDSAAAIRWLRGEGSPSRASARRVVQHYRRVVTDADLRVELRKVKAHGDGASRPSYVNNKVDQIARDAMRNGWGIYVEHETPGGHCGE